MVNQVMKAGTCGILALSVLLYSNRSGAQTTIDGRKGVPGTAVPFLRIGPDARSGAMGDVGIAISADANSQYWNVAKVVTSEKVAGVSLTYTPWLKDIVPDVYLLYLSGYYRFGQDTNQAISGSVRYFNLGEIPYRDEFNIPQGTGKPTEMAVDLGYSRRLDQNWSIGASLRYIYSNIAAGSVDIDDVYDAASAFASDIGVFYRNTKDLGDFKSRTIAAGAVISNLGSRISYTQEEKDFIPTNLGLGVAYTQQVDMYSKFTLALDLNKATTPTPVEKIVLNPDGTEKSRYWDKYTNLSVVQGFFKSFSVAPPGYGTTVSIGGEYWYQDQFAGRAGYFYEAEGNGGRQYFTVGLGVKYSVFGLNFSYLVPSGSSIARNPLSNTLRFSLTFDFDKEKMAANKKKKKKSEPQDDGKMRINPGQLQQAQPK